MIEHKAFECEHCGMEFEADQYDEAVEHEVDCDCNPALKRCGSCDFGRKVVRYEEQFIQCTILRYPNGTCASGRWLNNKKE